MRMTSVMRPWNDLNANVTFKPNSFNKVEVPWIPQWAPLSLISTLMWIDRVAERHFTTVYVKGETSLNHRVSPMPFKRVYVGRWIRCYSLHPTCTIKTDSISPSVLTVSPIIFNDGVYRLRNGAKEALAWRPFSIGWRKLSTATNNLKWTIRFNCPSYPSGELADLAVANRATQRFKH